MYRKSLWWKTLFLHLGLRPGLVFGLALGLQPGINPPVGLLKLRVDGADRAAHAPGRVVHAQVFQIDAIERNVQMPRPSLSACTARSVSSASSSKCGMLAPW